VHLVFTNIGNYQLKIFLGYYLSIIIEYIIKENYED